MNKDSEVIVVTGGTELIGRTNSVSLMTNETRYTAEQVQNKIAGALFDFVGHLTTRETPITLSACHDAAEPCELLSKFMRMRGLNADEADVKNWNKMS